MIGAGLVARNARPAGLRVPPWVKTSLSPGSQAVTDYLEQSGLQDDLDALGFNLTGYGCMTCIGNSGGLDDAIAGLTDAREIVGAAVLSGNRNFEGRINPHIKAAYLASPALVVAYALAGSALADLRTEPVGYTSSGDSVRLDQIWPSTFAADISDKGSESADSEKADEKVEEASQESYPASDAPAATGVLGVGRRKRAGDS